MTDTGRRPRHIIGGLIVFSLGLFFGCKNLLYMMEFVKGGLQPLFIVIGLTAAAAAVFSGAKSNRGLNVVIAVIFTVLGCFGIYDEYYTTMDFIHGFLPLLLITAGLFAFIHGIAGLKK